MAYNNSTHSNDAPFTFRKPNSRVIVVQVLILFFLYLNCLLLTTFFKKEVFHRSMRYIFFAYTLMSDCLYLLLSNVLLILSFYQIFIQFHICVLLLIVVRIYTLAFPLTLTAMTLERYVAICMPMQHGALCTARNTLHCILIITAISSIPISMSLSIYLALVPPGVIMEDRECTFDKIEIDGWYSHFKSAVNELYFVIMFVTIVVCYVQITKAARTASGETMKSSGKGLRTVLLHGLQLILCLAQLWCPFIEDAVLQIDFLLFINVRYSNYVMFIIAPRFLSSFVYGLRDRNLFIMLKYYAVFGLGYKSPPVLDEK